MKYAPYLQKLADRYYPIWTDDGIDAFHANAQEIAAWLNREDLRTASDAELSDLTAEEINAIAEMIAEMVSEAIESK